MHNPNGYTMSPLASEFDFETDIREWEGRTTPRRGSVPLTLGVAGDPRIIDLTAKADKSRRYRIREPQQVYALVLHQMACCFRVNDPLKRFLGMAPHFAILPDGRILQFHPLQAETPSSNGFNRGCVAVEFAGNFPNVKGKWWLSKKYLEERRKILRSRGYSEPRIQAELQAYINANRNQVTPQQIEAGRYLVRYLIRTMKHARGLTHILAHRQSSGTRENDPGPDIWYHVGQWAIDNFGLKDGGPGFKVGTGNPIPTEWRNWGLVRSQPASKEWDGEVDRKSSDYIQWIQRSLNRILGLRLVVDGRLGSQTRSAIKSFQQQQGLVVDGVVGTRTEKALLAVGAENPPQSIAPTYSPSPTPTYSPVTTDKWVLPSDVRASGERQFVRYDSAPPWEGGRNCATDITPGAKELRAYIRTRFPGVSSIGGHSCRQNTANSAQTSVHGTGRALDIMIAPINKRANSAVGDPIANWLVQNAEAIGVQYIIWNRVQWSGWRKGRKDGTYLPKNPHIDHIHVELNHDGARRITPWFSNRTR